MLQGLITALATPLDEKFHLNLNPLGKLIHYQEQAGVDGFYVGGTGGEGIMLSVQERKDLLVEFMRLKSTETKIVVHCSAFFEEDIVPLMKHAQKNGAEAVSLLPPGYFAPIDDEAVFQYYQRMCAQVDLPVMIYHLPAYSHFNISCSLFDRLMKIENLIGIKDSKGDTHQIYQFIHHEKEPVVLSGNDTVHLAALSNGAVGMISASANIMPDVFVDLWKASQSNELENAALAQQKIDEVVTEIFKYPFVPAIKQVLEWQGFEVGKPKSPARALTEQEQEIFLENLKQIHFI